MICPVSQPRTNGKPRAETTARRPALADTRTRAKRRETGAREAEAAIGAVRNDGGEGGALRHSFAETPPRVEYELTGKGLALLPIIEQMRRFGHDWLVSDPGHVHLG